MFSVISHQINISFKRISRSLFSHNYFSKLEKSLSNNDNTRISILLSSIVSTDFYSCDCISSAWLISIMYQIICIKIACGNNLRPETVVSSRTEHVS